MKVSKPLIFITVFFSEIFYFTGFLYSPHNECWNSSVAFDFPSALLTYKYFDLGSCILSLIFTTLELPAMISVLRPQRFRCMY